MRSKEQFATVAFFDLFEYPLTRRELYAWQLSPRVIENIALVVGEGDFVEHQEHHILPGREILIAQRAALREVNEQKMKRAEKFARLMQYVPFVKMVAVCNTLAYHNAREDSDIDVFIVIEKNRLWLTRMLITGITHVLRLRRHHKHIANRICLSFYITTDHLDLRPLMIEPLDPYFLYWLNRLVVLYDDGVYADFVQANQWLREYIPKSFSDKKIARPRVAASSQAQRLKRFFETILRSPLGALGEWKARFLQKKKMSFNTTSQASKDNTNVIIRDDILKFHEKDIRQQCLQNWLKKLQS